MLHCSLWKESDGLSGSERSPLLCCFPFLEEKEREREKERKHVKEKEEQ